MLGLLVIGLLFIVVLWAAILKPNALLGLYAMSLPFFGVIAEVGLQVTPVLVVSLGMMIRLLISHLRDLRFPTILIPYITFVLLVSVSMSFVLPESVYRFPLLRGELRWISQIIVFLLNIVPIIYIVNLRQGYDRVSHMIKIFIMTTLLLGVTGLVQLFVYRTTGNDLFPINMFSPGEKEDVFRSALSSISEKLRFLRMSGLGGGEPKHLGYTCVVAFNLLFLHWVYFSKRAFLSGAGTLLMAGLLIACVFLTLSTQAYLLLGLSILLLTLFMIGTLGLRKKRVVAMVILLAAGSTLVLKNAFISALIDARIYERLGETGAIEDFNVTILDFLKQNPTYLVFGTGLGNVHFFAFDYIPNEFKYYMKDSVFVAKAGLLRIISEQGFVGLLMFLTIIFYLAIKLKDRNIRIQREWKYLGLSFLVITISNFMVSSDSSPYYIFSIALCFALISISHHETA